MWTPPIVDRSSVRCKIENCILLQQQYRIVDTGSEMGEGYRRPNRPQQWPLWPPLIKCLPVFIIVTMFDQYDRIKEIKVHKAQTMRLLRGEMGKYHVFLDLPQNVMIDEPSATTGLNMMTQGGGQKPI